MASGTWGSILEREARGLATGDLRAQEGPVGAEPVLSALALALEARFVTSFGSPVW